MKNVKNIALMTLLGIVLSGDALALQDESWYNKDSDGTKNIIIDEDYCTPSNKKIHEISYDEIVSRGESCNALSDDINEYHYFKNKAEQKMANLKSHHIFPLQPNLLTHSQANKYCEDYVRVAGTVRLNGKALKTVDGDTFSYCMGSFMPFLDSEASGGKACEATTVKWMGEDKDGGWAGCIAEIDAGSNLISKKVNHNESLRGSNDTDKYAGFATFTCNNGEWKMLSTSSKCLKVPKVCDDLSEIHEWDVTFPSWASNPENNVDKCRANLEKPLRTGQAAITFAKNEGVESQANLDGFNFDARYVRESSLKTLYCFDGKVSDEELGKLLERNPEINPNILIESCHYDPKDCNSEDFSYSDNGLTCNVELPKTKHRYDPINTFETENGAFIDIGGDIGFGSGSNHGKITNAKCFNGAWDLSGATKECYQNPVCNISPNFGNKELVYTDKKTKDNSENELDNIAFGYFINQCENLGGTLNGDTFNSEIKYKGNSHNGDYTATIQCEGGAVLNPCSVGSLDGDVAVLDRFNRYVRYQWVCKSGLREVECLVDKERPPSNDDCDENIQETMTCSNNSEVINFGNQIGKFDESRNVQATNNLGSCSVDLACKLKESCSDITCPENYTYNPDNDLCEKFEKNKVVIEDGFCESRINPAGEVYLDCAFDKTETNSIYYNGDGGSVGGNKYHAVEPIKNCTKLISWERSNFSCSCDCAETITCPNNFYYDNVMNKCIENVKDGGYVCREGDFVSWAPPLLGPYPTYCEPVVVEPDEIGPDAHTPWCVSAVWWVKPNYCATYKAPRVVDPIITSSCDTNTDPNITADCYIGESKSCQFRQSEGNSGVKSCTVTLTDHFNAGDVIMKAGSTGLSGVSVDCSHAGYNVIKNDLKCTSSGLDCGASGGGNGGGNPEKPRPIDDREEL